nr:hypothetical protein [Acidimicrobiia bacterium]
ASFVRREIAEARRQAADGSISSDERRVVEDAAIIDPVGKQEAFGISGITDGELRRFMFHVDFLERSMGHGARG